MESAKFLDTQGIYTNILEYFLGIWAADSLLVEQYSKVRVAQW